MTTENSNDSSHAPLVSLNVTMETQTYSTGSNMMVTMTPIVPGNLNLYFLFFIPSAALLGNLLVFLSIRRSVALQRMFYYVSCSLCVSNMLTALLIMPVFVFHHTLGDFRLAWPVCVVYVVVDTLLLASSLTHLTLLAYNTRRALLHPLNYRVYSAPRHLAAQLALAWGAALLLALPHLAVTLGKEGVARGEVGIMRCVWITSGQDYYLARYVPALLLPLLVSVGMCLWTAKDAKQQGRVLDKISSVVENNGVICNGSAIMPDLMVIEAVMEAESQQPITASDIHTSIAPSSKAKKQAPVGGKGKKGYKVAKAGGGKKAKGKGGSGAVKDAKKAPVVTDRVQSKRSSYAEQRQRRLMSARNDDEEEQEGVQMMSVQAEVHSSDGSSQDGLDKDLSDFDDAESLGNNDGFSDMDSVCRSISTNSSCSGFVIYPTDSEASSKKDEDGSDAEDGKETENAENASIKQEDQAKIDDAQVDKGSGEFISAEDKSQATYQSEEDPCLQNNSGLEDNTEAESDSANKHNIAIIEKHVEDPESLDNGGEDNKTDESDGQSLLAPPKVEHKLDIEAANSRQMLENGEGLSPALSMASGYDTLTSDVQSLADSESQFGDKTPTSVSRQDSGCDPSESTLISDKDDNANRESDQKDGQLNTEVTEMVDTGSEPTGKEKLNMPLEEKDIDLIIGPDSEKLIQQENGKGDEAGIENPAFDKCTEGMPKNPDGTVSLSEAIKVRCPSVCNEKNNEDKIEPAEVSADSSKLDGKNGSNDSLAPGDDSELAECKITPGRRSILKRDNSKRNSHRKSVKFASDVGEPKVTQRESRKIVRKGTKHTKVTHPQYARQQSVVSNTNNTQHTNGHVPKLSQLSIKDKNMVKKPLSPEVSSSLEYLTKLNSVQGKRATQRLKKDRNTLKLVVALLVSHLLLLTPYIVLYGLNLPYPHDAIPELAMYVLQFLTYCTTLVVPGLMLVFSADMRSNCTGVVCCMPQEYGNGWGEQGEADQEGGSSVPFGFDMVNGKDEAPIKVEGSNGATGNGHVVESVGEAENGVAKADL